MTNIPIYRAKRLDNGEYVEGCMLHDNEKNYIVTQFRRESGLRVHLLEHEVDPSIISIHFPDMLDKNNKPIFASLSEDGKLSDLIKSESWE